MNSRGCVLLVVTAVLVWGTYSFAQTEQTEAAATSLFRAHCTMCHGPDGKGNTSMGKALHVANLQAPQAQDKTDAELATIIENGKGNMPEFKGMLTPEQIRELANYLHELPKLGTVPAK